MIHQVTTQLKGEESKQNERGKAHLQSLGFMLMWTSRRTHSCRRRMAG